MSGYLYPDMNTTQVKSIGGIDHILPALGEVTWFLQNSGRSFKVGNVVPKGLLLVGPAGTGKTFLVQAIAGEANVPVLVESGSSLKNKVGQEDVGAERLKKIFARARQLAPCIVFIDEIDALGERRELVIQNPMGPDGIIESVYEASGYDPGDEPSEETNFIEHTIIEDDKEDEDEDYEPLEPEIEADQEIRKLTRKELKVLQELAAKSELKHEQQSLLMQFLIELDGLFSRNGVFVIGATNRPKVLDQALMRPGRLDQVLELQLPGKTKRIEILKLYSKKLGVDRSVVWNYLANRTVGFSAADLAALMNESAMQAILQDTVHTIETIEKGIDLISSYSIEKPNLAGKTFKDPFHVSRLAYYQAGKAIVHSLLPLHPPAVVLYLWPRPKNSRHVRVGGILQNDFSEISRRAEFETRMVGFYAGKASELLLLSTNFHQKTKVTKQNTRNSSKINTLQESDSRPDGKKFLNAGVLSNTQKSLGWLSDLGMQDLNHASSLGFAMINKWYFYSKNVSTAKLTSLVHNRNAKELNNLELLELLHLYSQ
nr:ftsH [Streptosarcina sp. YL-2023a]